MFKLINEKKAFTLIELVAVIVLLAILMTASVFYANNVMNNSKSKIKSKAVDEIIRLTNATILSNNLKFPIDGTIKNGKVILSKNSNSYTLDYYNEDLTGGTIFVDASGNITALSVTFNDGYICTMASSENGCGKMEAKALIMSNQIDDTYLKNDPQEPERKVFAGNIINTPNRLKIKENGVEKNYRIVSLESDGTIKVIREESYGSSPYDSPQNPLGSRTGANNTYCINEGSSGCNAWQSVDGIYRNGDSTGKVSIDSQVKNLLNKTFYPILNEFVKENIISNVYSLSPGNYASLETLYNRKKGINGQEQYKYDVQTKIGLLDVRDWFLASSNSYNGTCEPGTDGLGYYNGSNNLYQCGKENYLLTDYWWWLISPAMGLRGNTFRVSSIGDVNNISSSAPGAIRPVFYLSNNVSLNGNGTIDNPYRLTN